MSYADLMLLGIPVALWAAYPGNSPMVAFVASAIAVLRLASWMGHATEEVSIHSGPRIGGFLNGTFGNAAELIIAILAIRAGLYEVVKASITGSILGNSLLVLGAAAFTGGLKHKSQSFNRVVARFNVSLMFVAVAALIIPAVFHGSPHPISDLGLQRLSLWTAFALLAVYIASLLFSFKTHVHLFVSEGGLAEKAGWSFRKAVAVLLGATVGVVIMSEILVHSLEPVIARLGWSELFVGIVVVAFVGNAAEHATAISMALQDRMGVAVEIAIGSTTQIAMLVAPIAVIASNLLGSGMSLEFLPSELVAIFVSLLTVNQITRDGETNWLEGFMLLAAYLIVAVAFYYVPAH